MYSSWRPNATKQPTPLNGFRNKADPVREVNLHFKDGGLGDQICRLPPVAYLVKTNPNLKIHLWVPDYFLKFAQASLINELPLEDFERIHFYSESEFTPNHPCRKHPSQATDETQTHTSLRSHLVDLACRTLIDQDLPMEHKNYLKVGVNNYPDRHGLPIRKYAAICAGFTAPVREFLPQTINAVSKYVQSLGLIPVFLGSSRRETGAIQGIFSNELDLTSGVVNLIDKTKDLLETAALLNRARVVIGLDNGLLHLAATTRDTLPIVAGYTSVSPEFRLPIRAGRLGHNVYTVLPDESLECRGCQSEMSLVYTHDFRLCYYEDYTCLSQLSVPKWINAITEALS